MSLPKLVYVREEQDGNSKYLVAHRSLFDAADMSEERTVGVYKLAEVRTVNVKVESAPAKARKARN